MKPMLTAAATALAASIGAAGAQANEETDKSQAQAQTRAQLFAEIDANGDGAITRSEFVSYAREQKGLSEAQAEKEFDELSAADRRVSREAFMRSEDLQRWTRAGEAAGTAGQSSRIGAFHAVDENGDNEISRAEFASFARDEARMTKAQAELMFDELADGSDAVSRVEFLAAEDNLQPIVQAYDARAGERAPAGANPHFEAMDDNNDDIVSRSEFASFIDNADNVTQRDARRLFDAAAGDDREMTLVEFVSGGERIERIAEDIVGEPGPLLRSAQTERSDDARDQAGAGAVREDAAESDLSVTFNEMDRNNDGEVRKSEFVEMARRRAEEEFDRVAGRDDALTREELADAEVELIQTSRLED